MISEKHGILRVLRVPIKQIPHSSSHSSSSPKQGIVTDGPEITKIDAAQMREEVSLQMLFLLYRD